jgi:hypothetical protein
MMLTNQRRRGVIGGAMATDDGLPFRVELPEAQYLVLLKYALNRSRAAALLAAAVEHEGKKKRLLPRQRLCDGRPRPARLRWSTRRRLCPRLSGR